MSSGGKSDTKSDSAASDRTDGPTRGRLNHGKTLIVSSIKKIFTNLNYRALSGARFTITYSYD